MSKRSKVKQAAVAAIEAVPSVRADEAVLAATSMDQTIGDAAEAGTLDEALIDQVVNESVADHLAAAKQDREELAEDIEEPEVLDATGQPPLVTMQDTPKAGESWGSPGTGEIRYVRRIKPSSRASLFLITYKRSDLDQFKPVRRVSLKRWNKWLAASGAYRLLTADGELDPKVEESVSAEIKALTASVADDIEQAAKQAPDIDNDKWDNTSPAGESAEQL